MGKPTTMTVEQGTCKIYPSKQTQFCSHIRVMVQRLKPGVSEPADWVPEDESLRNVDLLCSEGGLVRLLKAVDNGTNPPTPRERRAPAHVPAAKE